MPLSRFKDVKITDEKFAVPEDFALLFDSKMANYVLEREWHKDQIMEQKEDGSVYLKFFS